jgi:PhoH-like ATPase
MVLSTEVNSSPVSVSEKSLLVLDTNVILHDPNALMSLKGNDIVIPIYVIEEIDTFKKSQSSLGRNARQFSRYLDGLRQTGSLSKGIEVEGGGSIRIATSSHVLQETLDLESNQDTRILTVAYDLKNQFPERDVKLITKDMNLRLRADAVDVDSEDYDPLSVPTETLYAGHRFLDVATDQINSFHAEGHLELEDNDVCVPNECVVVRDLANPAHTTLGRVQENTDLIKPLIPLKHVWGITPRNKEQRFALDILMDDSIKLVTLVGKAGTGKTLLALAAGLQKVTEDKAYSRLLVSRPIFPLGKDIGYLPGSVEEKLNPWMQPIYDNVEFLLNMGRDDKKSGRSSRELVDLGIMKIEPLTYIRGRSIPAQFMIVDEAQNLTPHEVKTIISRAGEGTKIILTGDPNQIDNPYIDATNNGLVHVVNQFKEQGISGHVVLLKGERSPLAELATQLL